MSGSDGGAPDSIDAIIATAAVAAGCGDQLITRLHYVNGGSDFLELQAHLWVP